MPAAQRAILPINKIGIIEMPLSLRIRIAKAINWREVFSFAILETGTLILIPAKYSLNPETAISLKRIIKAGITSQSAITSFEVKIKITAATNNLSAIGSKKSS